MQNYKEHHAVQTRGDNGRGGGANGTSSHAILIANDGEQIECKTE